MELRHIRKIHPVGTKLVGIEHLRQPSLMIHPASPHASLELDATANRIA